MRAVTFSRLGGPEVLEVSELAAPQPGPSEVRIRGAAATVNPTDISFRSGRQLTTAQLSEMGVVPPYIPGMEMAGKTGSAQVRRITMAERLAGIRKNEDLPWPMRDHALFICFAPASAPRYAAAVVVEHGGGGAKVAGPIARDIMLECQQRDPAHPPGGTKLAAIRAEG